MRGKKTNDNDCNEKTNGDYGNKFLSNAASFWSPLFSTPEEERDYPSFSISNLFAFCGDVVLRDENPALTAMFDELRQMLSEIEQARQSAIIAFFGASKDKRSSSIVEDDLLALRDITDDIPKSVTRLDLIIDSQRAMVQTIDMIVPFLRDRFSEINLLIPKELSGIASLTAFACDSIIFLDGAFLSAPLLQIKCPNNEYMPILEFSELAARVKKQWIWKPQEAMKSGWNMEQILMAEYRATEISEYCEHSALEYLVKYIYGHKQMLVRKPYMKKEFKKDKRFKEDYERSENIAKAFMNSSNAALDYQAVKDLGLNATQAEGKLKELMDKTNALSAKLFDDHNASKLWFASSICFMQTAKTQDEIKRNCSLSGSSFASHSSFEAHGVGGHTVFHRTTEIDSGAKQSNIAPVKTESAGGVNG
jgi:hypothetical protein